jgi:hypothetical protein
LFGLDRGRRELSWHHPVVFGAAKVSAEDEIRKERVGVAKRSAADAGEVDAILHADFPVGLLKLACFNFLDGGMRRFDRALRESFS